MNSIKIIANGAYFPKQKVDNKELAKKYNITDEYIYKRTGIENRFFANDETIEEVAIKASKQAIENYNIDKQTIDMIIVATTSSDKIMPGISFYIQKELDIKNSICLDVLAGCAGYINSLDIARNYIAIGKVNRALVVGVDVLSNIINESDMGTAIILSDGAGAIIIEKSDVEKKYESCIESKGQDGDILVYNSNNKIKMDGTKVYKYAVRETVKNISKLLQISGENIEDIKYIIPHQSNQKIINSISARLQIEDDKIYNNIKNVGNTFCASIPIVLGELLEKNKLLAGDKIILLGYGGGLNTGSILLEI